MNSMIFIVDDDPFWILMLKKTLKNLGYCNIIAYNNGNDCISNLHQNPALIYLDYEMDNMNGLEVLQIIKEKNRDVGVIFCTAHQDFNVAINAMKFGSTEYLLKEYDKKLKDIVADSLKNLAAG